MPKKYSFIDLFAGCGGLSEGFLQTGLYKALAHVEWEMPMVETLRHRLVQKWGHSEEDAKKRVVCFDVQKTEELIHGNWSEDSIKLYLANNSDFTAEHGLEGLVGNNDVDLIIGGPPCQAYSIAGRAQSPTGMKFDYRNYLFESFVKIVDYFEPKVFVFENVPGLLSACPGDKPVKNRIFEAFSAIGYEIRTPNKLKDAVFCAEDYETPQKRNRVIIIGVKKDGDYQLEDFYNELVNRKQKTQKTVRDAIEGMPQFRPVTTVMKKGNVHISHVLVEPCDDKFHIARYHNQRDIQIFYEWLANDMNHYTTEERLNYYTKKTGKKSNHIKYRSLEWDKPSPTIVAHLHKDGLMFIHPDINQLRSITMREAALLQSFPKDYIFYGSTAYCYKMIGNAVPVQFAKNIAIAVYKTLFKKKKK